MDMSALEGSKLGDVEYKEAAAGEFVLNGIGYMEGSSQVRPMKRVFVVVLCIRH